jgi:predicted amidohydrolase YtcJ
MARLAGALLSLALVALTPLGAQRAPAAAAPGPVTLAVVNARVWTGVVRRPWADAVVVRGDRLALVGGSAEARKLAAGAPGARVIDARGAMVVPGFTDAHVHFVDGGLRLSSVQLRDARTPQEFAERIRAFAATVPAGTWILGGDWDHERWGGALPERAWIDALVPDHPVFVSRLDGHMALANARALALAGVTRDVADVEGGAIGRDPAGALTGLLRDNAMALVWRAVPPTPPAMADRALDAAMRHVAAQGVTAVQAMGSWDDLAVYERAWAAGRLGTRVSAHVPLETWAQLADTVRRGRRRGGRGTAAWSATRGCASGAQGLRRRLARRAHGGHARAVQRRAAGPRALRDAARVAARVDDRRRRRRAAGGGARHRRRGQPHDARHLRARAAGERRRGGRAPLAHRARAAPRRLDVPRFARLGVIASMQPYHAIDDGRWAERVIGPERARLTYAFRSLLDAGATVAFGSDWFVAPPTPLEGIYAAVTRRTLDDARPGGWVPAQRSRWTRRCARTRGPAPTPASTTRRAARSSAGSSPTSCSSIATSRA